MAGIPVPDKVHELVRAFDEADANYIRSLNEFTTRTRFIDPLFEALGWNVTHARGAGQLYDEVVFEDTFRLDDSLADVSSIGKRPDYSFRIDGERKFYVEAKKPAEPLDSNRAHAFQVRAYGWSARLPVSILTDFEEFSVYDCRVRPDHDDQPSTARLPNFYIRYNQYADRWADIAELLHRDAVAAGSLDRFVETVRPPRGTQTVDAAFLKDISMWREVLARDIARRNPDLDQRDLNYAVQMTINRIIFLRICEDRGIEPRETLKGALVRAHNATEGYIYRELVRLFDKADQRYNSGLFHFRHERNRSEHPDNLTPSLKVSDDTLANIIGHLYYPYPYKFDVIPVEILGQVYEQFLGKVIVRAPGGDVTVEEKPEVRKAGGVYYTPAYIVDYIVEHTVGKLLDGKTPEQAAQLRILDPACGSGSFLIGAYSYLLDWHLRYYLDHDPERLADRRRKDRPIEEVPRPGASRKRTDGAQDRRYRLTVEERKRILLNNIYGVDIDSQAVEVTKLSLLLKVLEGEREGELQATLQFDPHARVLPDLGDNIKCGNSLIGPDFYQGTQSTFLDLEEARRVNAFDWHAAFPASMGAGGFDAVIGNPPYVRSINLKVSDPVLWDLYRTHYKSASSREWDIYLIFVEKGLDLLNAQGKLGYILPNKFLNSQVGANLRTILANGGHLDELIHFGAYQIFAGATTYTCLLLLNKHRTEQARTARFTGSLKNAPAPVPLPQQDPNVWSIATIGGNTLSDEPWEFSASGGELLAKLRAHTPLGEISQVFQGTGTRADRVYLLERRGMEGEYVRVYSPERGQEYLLEDTYLKPALRGRSIGRYHINGSDLLLLVPYRLLGGKSIIVSEEELAGTAPNTLAYLRACRERLDEREDGRFKNRPDWFAYGYPRSMTKFDSCKIVLPDVANKGKCYLEQVPHWLIDTAYGIDVTDSSVQPQFVLGVLNSPILTYYLKETGTALRGGYFRMKTAYLNPFPIRTIDHTNPTDKARHDRMVQLVERMLALHRQLAEARTPHDKAFLQAQIDATDREIDRLVYDLYDLTEEEIAIVEGREQ